MARTRSLFRLPLIGLPVLGDTGSPTKGVDYKVYKECLLAYHPFFPELLQ